MSKNVLNIGAGVIPLLPSEIGADHVVNYDPLGMSENRSTSYETAIAYNTFVLNEKDWGAFCLSEGEVDIVCGNWSRDLILAISPYGYSVISDWSNKKLKVGGIVLILSAGNNPFGTNKWKSNGKCIVNDVNIAKYYETIDIAGCDVWLIFNSFRTP